MAVTLRHTHELLTGWLCLILAWHTNGQNREPLLIADNHAAVTLGNAFATQEAWAIAGKTIFENSDQQGAHNCIPRGARAERPCENIPVGLCHSRDAIAAWQAVQSVRAADCQAHFQHISTLIRKLFVSDTVLGWGSRPLVFFARYLAGRLERPAVLLCVAQTGVVSPVGGDQAPRYHPWGLL